MNKRFEVYVTQSSFCPSTPRGRDDTGCNDDPINRYYKFTINFVPNHFSLYGPLGKNAENDLTPPP